MHTYTHIYAQHQRPCFKCQRGKRLSALALISQSHPCIRVTWSLRCPGGSREIFSLKKKCFPKSWRFADFTRLWVSPRVWDTLNQVLDDGGSIEHATASFRLNWDPLMPPGRRVPQSGRSSCSDQREHGWRLFLSVSWTTRAHRFNSKTHDNNKCNNNRFSSNKRDNWHPSKHVFNFLLQIYFIVFLVISVSLAILSYIVIIKSFKIYIYIYLNMYIFIYIYVYIYIYIYMCVYLYICVYIYIYVCIFIFMCIFI